MKPFEDPDHQANSSLYHRGKTCIEPGCKNPAGTVWSPYWCQKHNAERILRIDREMESLRKQLEAKK